jgi:hypothetical protein
MTMRKLILPIFIAALFLLWPRTASAAAGYCSFHTVKATSNNNSVTTDAGDTTGCTSFFVCVASGVTDTAVITENKSNTVTPVTISEQASHEGLACATVRGTTVGSGHTFTGTATGGFPSIAVIGANGTATAVTVDAQNGAQSAGGATTLATGSISPDSTSIAFAAIFWADATSMASIGSSFTITDTQAYVGGTNYGISMAYKTTLSGSENPTWSWTSSVAAAAKIAAFDQAATTIASRRSLGPRTGSRQAP